MSTIKRGRCPVCPAPSRNARSRAPSGRHQSRHGKAGAGPPLNQLEPCFPSIPPCCSSPTCPPLPQSRHLVGIPVTTATTAGRRHPPPPSPAFSLPHPSPRIGPLGPKGQSPPAPGRSRPAVHRNLPGPPPVGARGPHCEATTLSEDQIANQGSICKHLKLLGACV
jgi:hypothetical protein